MNVSTFSLRLRSSLLGAVACLATAAAMAADLPTVALFTTGGTIQSMGKDRLQLAEYQSGQVTPQKIIDDVPEVKELAKFSINEISNIGSGNITADHLLRLAKGLNAELAKPEIKGAIVTHGTGTLEETAYFLNLTVRSKKPVVVIGAMRPWSAISRDGPFNFYQAVRTVLTPEAVGKGVMVLLNDTIHSARYVTKNNTYHVETFVDREIGPIGYADMDRVAFYRNPLVKHTADSEFDVSNLTELPAVDIVYGYQEASRAPIDALVAAGVKGIILNDGAPSFAKAVAEAQAKGVIVVQSDRKGSGRVVLSDSMTARQIVTADNLNAQKARMLLRLALTKTHDAKEIQRIFNEY